MYRAANVNFNAFASFHLNKSGMDHATNDKDSYYHQSNIHSDNDYYFQILDYQSFPIAVNFFLRVQIETGLKSLHAALKSPVSSGKCYASSDCSG
jgi:hypothetical protein